MASLVLAIGTSFSPLLAVSPEDWPEYCKGDLKRQYNRRDGSLISYEELHALNGDKYASQTTQEEFRRRSKLAQDCLGRVVAELDAAKPDVVVVIGDDHGELFDSSNLPALSVYRGAELANSGLDRRTLQYLEKDKDDGPAWRRAIRMVQAIDAGLHYPGHPAFADSLIQGLIENDVDVSVAAEPKDLAKSGLGFAWGFAVNRLLGERRIPIVPVMLNTWYPPNVPTPKRCFAIGKALEAAITGSKQNLRVAVVCGGGLSHLGIDQELDLRMLNAARAHDAVALSQLPREALVSGSCQLLNWVVLAGVADRLENKWLEYLPVYRTPAGTGIGLAFTYWS